MKTEPKHIPSIVGQALAWLDKMKIAYRYVPDADLWEFVYDGLYLLMIARTMSSEYMRQCL